VGFLVTDPLLVAERAKIYEAGLRFWSGPWGSANMTFFRMDVRHELFFDDTTFSEINIDEVRHQGIEGDARFTPCACLEFFGSYTLTKVTIEESATPSQEGKTYPVTPKYAGAGGVTCKYEGASLTASGRYAGRRFLISDLDNVGQTLPPYLVYDARVSYAWRALTAFVAVYNVTNRKYNDSGGLGLFGGPDRFSPAPERSWLAGGEVRF
jgi:Fe(3+) dicitrate transport protein